MRVMYVGEKLTRNDEALGTKFSGPQGWLLRNLLKKAGLHNIYLTNVLNFYIPTVDQLLVRQGITPAYKRGLFLPTSIQDNLQRLQAEVDREKPDVIIASGALPLWYFCGHTNIKEARGYFTKDGILPTYSIQSVLAQYNLHPVFYLDLCKASKGVRHVRTEVITRPTLQIICDFTKEVKGKLLAADIETADGLITEISFAASPKEAIVIPFLLRPDKNYWKTFEEEKQAWKLVKHLCETHPIIGQNFAYDIKYLAKVGIAPNWVGDTMLLHHAIYPELEKSLRFLASIYADRVMWKQMRKEVTRKKGD